jgi:hypothetical protein
LTEGMALINYVIKKQLEAKKNCRDKNNMSVNNKNKMSIRVKQPKGYGRP